MFVINPKPTFEATVAVPVPGTTETAQLPLVFRHKGRKDLQAWIQSAKDRQDLEFLAEVIEGWGAGVVDETGKAVPFDQAALGKVLDAYPAAGDAIFKAYLEELTAARRGNSAGRP